jgi:hypothetical protein
MFGLLPFIECFFFLSLGITFILIFLMVFHFKQRIEKLERNHIDLSDLCNRIVREVTNLHQSSKGIQRNFVNPKEHICENIMISTSTPISFKNENKEETTYNKIIVMDDILDVEDESVEDYDVEDLEDESVEEDDGEDVEEDDGEDVEDDDVEDDGDEVGEDYEVKKEETKSIRIFDNNEIESTDVTELIKLDNEEDIPTTTTTTTTPSTQMNYQKLNVQQLKILAISKGLCSDTTKMKRADLIKLLTNEEQNN